MRLAAIQYDFQIGGENVSVRWAPDNRKYKYSVSFYRERSYKGDMPCNNSEPTTDISRAMAIEFLNGRLELSKK